MMANDFSTFDTVFCNTLEGLAKARVDGLAQDARVWTYAPAVALHGGPGVAALEQPEQDAYRAQFAQSLAKLSGDVFRALDADEAAKPYAISLARQTLQLHRVLFKLFALGEDDYTQPRLFIEPKSGTEDTDARTESPLPALLDGNPNAEVVHYDVSVPTTKDAVRPPIWTWLRMSNRYEILYRLLRYWWGRKRFGANKKRAVIVSDPPEVGLPAT